MNFVGGTRNEAKKRQTFIATILDGLEPVYRGI